MEIEISSEEKNRLEPSRSRDVFKTVCPIIYSVLPKRKLDTWASVGSPECCRGGEEEEIQEESWVLWFTDKI